MCDPELHPNSENIYAPTNGGKGYRTDKCWCMYYLLRMIINNNRYPLIFS